MNKKGTICGKPIFKNYTIMKRLKLFFYRKKFYGTNDEYLEKYGYE